LSPRLVFTGLSSRLEPRLVSLITEPGSHTTKDSKGSNEAIELRDGDKSKWAGKGTQETG